MDQDGRLVLDLSALVARIAALEARPAPPPVVHPQPVDLGPLIARIAAVEQRQAQLATAAAAVVHRPPPATEAAVDLAPLLKRIAALEETVNAETPPPLSSSPVPAPQPQPVQRASPAPTPAPPAPPPVDLAPLVARIAALESKPAAEVEPDTAPLLASVTRSFARADARMDALAQRVDEVDEALGQAARERDVAERLRELHQRPARKAEAEAAKSLRQAAQLVDAVRAAVAETEARLGARRADKAETVVVREVVHTVVEVPAQRTPPPARTPPRTPQQLHPLKDQPAPSPASTPSLAKTQCLSCGEWQRDRPATASRAERTRRETEARRAREVRERLAGAKAGRKPVGKVKAKGRAKAPAAGLRDGDVLPPVQPDPVEQLHDDVGDALPDEFALGDEFSLEGL